MFFLGLSYVIPKLFIQVSIFTFQILSDLPSNLIAYHSEFFNTYSANVQILLRAKYTSVFGKSMNTW